MTVDIARKPKVTQKISQHMTYESDPATVFAMYIDPAFIELKNRKTGGFDVEVNASADQVAGGTLVASRKLPAQVPGFVRRMTGDTISITETDVWGAVDEAGVRRGTVLLEFPGLPMKATGTFTLRPESTGASCQVDVELKASVPLIGGKIEAMAGQQFSRAIGAEERIGRQWLAEH